MGKLKSVEEYYQDYLKRCGIVESNLLSVQANEMRKAFFGGAASMHVVFTNEIPKIEKEEDCLKAIDFYNEDLTDYWTNKAT